MPRQVVAAANASDHARVHSARANGHERRHPNASGQGRICAYARLQAEKDGLLLAHLVAWVKKRAGSLSLSSRIDANSNGCG